MKQRLVSIFSLLLLIVFIAFIAGCNSGSSSKFPTSTGNADDGTGSDGTDGTDGSGDGTPTPMEVQIGGIIDGSFVEGQLASSVSEGAIISNRTQVEIYASLINPDGTAYTTPVDITFSSEFSDEGSATISEVATTVDGTATAVYQAGAREGQDTITATAEIDGVTITAIMTLMIENNMATHINFISATPEIIALKNTGGPGRSETSTLVFEVVDEYGDPIANQTVDFKLSTTVGGLTLTNESAVSNDSGLVTTTVNAGTVSTHIRVHATLKDSDPIVSIVSDELIISTGLPDQDSISIAVEFQNPEGLRYNNVEVPVIFQAADHFNNFVPDGTVVYFTTELGSIDDSCVLEDGVCEVLWKSGNPRQSYCDQHSPGCISYLSTILAFLVGEESFVDFNGNGVFDEGDTYTDTSEPFRDDNDNAIHNTWEPWWDFNNNGQWDGVNFIYNGSLCSESAEAASLCSTDLIYAQEDIQIVLSDSFAIIKFSKSSLDLRGGDSGTVNITISDLNGNAMPYGSKVEVSTTNGKIVGEAGFEFPSTLGPVSFSVTLIPDDEDKTTFGVLIVKVTTPFNNISSAQIGVLDDA